ncbi:putative peroxiredoxin [compost metagenome]
MLAWYPAAFTGGCTAECKSFAEAGPQIKAFDVAYFMASTDAADRNKEFAVAMQADFPLLSDPEKKVAAAYGVLNPKGMASRWTFYVGKDGKILAIDKAVKVDTSAEDMVAKLGELNVSKAKSN